MLIVTPPRFFTEPREESRRNRHADKIDWHRVQRRSLLESANRLLTHAGGEVGIDDTHNIVDALIGRAGWEQAQNFAEALVAPVNLEIVVKAKTDETDDTDGELQKRTKDHADCDAHDTAFEKLDAKDINAVRKDEDTDNNTDVIKRRRERVENEAAHCLLHARKHRRDREQEWVNCNHAHHVNCERHRRFVKAWRHNVAHEWFGKNHDEN